MSKWLAVLLLSAAAAVAAGCSWGPVVPSDAPVSDTTWKSWGKADGAHPAHPSSRPASQVVDLATSFLGTPYRWGGATPAGFDCSGLVYYTYRKAGLAVPRTSQEQFRAATPVPIARAVPGDLVFFGRRGSISHVGIYIGDQRFIHAPEAGRAVTIANLGDQYYRARFAGAGRIGL
jgi:cell wall-associated NlpC family hydrolase